MQARRIQAEPTAMHDSKTSPRAVTKPIVYIDGEAGTTGLEIRRRLDALADRLEVRSIDAASRKDDAARRAMMRQADLVVFCLPDAAAVEAQRAVRALAALGDNPYTEALLQLASQLLQRRA